MGAREDRYKDIDANIAANVRARREALGISQEDLGERLAEAGFPFSQATIWKIENGHRPVRAAELAALADALGEHSAMSLTWRPDTGQRLVDLRQAIAHAYTTWHQAKGAAAEYLEAQLELAVMAHLARKAGIIVTEMDVSWLAITPEEAVFEARAEADSQEEHSERRDLEVARIMAALIDSGYRPHLCLEDVKTIPPGNAPVWQPGEEVISLLKQRNSP